MSPGLTIAAAEGAANHAALLGVVVLIAVVGGLVFGLIRLLGKARAARTGSGRGAEATRSDRDPEA